MADTQADGAGAQAADEAAEAAAQLAGEPVVAEPTPDLADAAPAADRAAVWR